MLISPTYEQHKKAKLLRWFGLDRENSPDMRCEQNVKDWGYKFHMNDINATIGLCNFEDVEEVVHKHRENGYFLDEMLKDIEVIKLVDKHPSAESSYWIYTLRVEDREAFVKQLAGAGIAASQVHDRNDKHACLSKYRIPLPGTDELMSDMISIPCGWWVGEEEREHIVDTIEGGW